MKFNKLVLLCGLLSATAYATNIDPKGLVKKSAELSEQFDIKKTLEDAKKVDLSHIDFQAVSDATEKNFKQKVDLKKVKEEFVEIASDPNNKKQMNGVQAISGIADLNDAMKREEALNLLGLSETRNHLYIFISYSMPIGVIKAYAREAMWSGASLVIRGLEEGEDIQDFLKKKALPLVEGKGYAASLNIDPRLFDAFGIDYVPAIVLSEDDFTEYCRADGEKLTDFNVTRKCALRPDDSYIKISGNLTLDYALEQFQEEGTFLESATERLEVLRENIGRNVQQSHPDKFMVNDTLMPFQKEKLIKEYSKYGEVVDDEHGLSVIPFEPPKGRGVHFKRHEKKNDLE